MPAPENVTMFGNRAFEEVTEVTWVGVTLTTPLEGDEDRHPPREDCEDGGEDGDTLREDREEGGEDEDALREDV